MILHHTYPKLPFVFHEKNQFRIFILIVVSGSVVSHILHAKTFVFPPAGLLSIPAACQLILVKNIQNTALAHI